MSIIYCEGCDNQVDTDYVECFKHENKLICADCYNKLDVFEELDASKYLAYVNYHNQEAASCQR